MPRPQSLPFPCSCDPTALSERRGVGRSPEGSAADPRRCRPRCRAPAAPRPAPSRPGQRLISSAIRAYSLRIDTRPWETEMKPPSTATISRWPSSQKITTALGTSTAEHRLVTGQDADVALDRLGDDVGRLARPHHAVGRDDLDLHRLSHVHSGWARRSRSPGTTQPLLTQPSFCSSDQRRSTSSMPPTLKNACSAMWSTSPSQIIWNDSMVSFSGTVEPGMLVNFVAM